MKNTRFRNITVKLLLGLFVIGASSYAYAQTIGPSSLPQTDLQKLMNKTVESRIIVYRPRVILDGREIRSGVGPNFEYKLEFRIRNTGSQLTFENVQIRVQGRLDQVAFFSDSTFEDEKELDYEGKPRTLINLDMPLSPRDETTVEAYFVARQFWRTSDLQFKVGVYAVIKPEGHAWYHGLRAQ